MSSNIEVKLDVLNQKASPALYSAALSDRPAASFTGRLFVDSDNPSTGIYRDTGSTWIQIADQTGSLTGYIQTRNVWLTSVNARDFTYGIGGSKRVLVANDDAGFPSVPINTLFINYLNDFTVGTVFGGKVGINTNTPGVSLDVHGTTGTLVQIENDTTNNTLLAFRNQGAGYWNIGNNYNSGLNDFIIYDAVSFINRFTIKGTGQTFIGTDTTSSGLLVVNSATSDNHIVCIGANAPSIRLRNTGTSPTLNAGFGISTATNNFIQGSASGNYCIFNASTTASPILFGVYDSGAGNTQEAARISGSQNLIVGSVIDSGQKLQVAGTTAITSGSTASNVNILSLLQPNFAATFGPFISIGVANSVRNSGTLQFNYVSLGSTSNSISLSVYGIAGLSIKGSGVVNIANVPTSAVGLVSGDIYSNLGVLTIVP